MKRATQILLFAVALAFLSYYAYANWTDVRNVLQQFSAWHIALATLLIVASLYCKSLVNLLLLRVFLHTRLDHIDLLHSYTQSQIVKYIPGKIWGILFQASTLSNNARKGDVWVVNLYQLFIMNFATLLVLVAALLFYDALSLSIRALLVFSCVAIAGLFYFNIGRIVRLLKLDEGTFKKYAALIDRDLTLKIAGLITLDWLFYIGMWYALAYGQMEFSSVLSTAINYATASLVGILVFFLPSGLIARETAFVAFGRALGENTSLLLVYGIVARLIFIAGDFLLFLIVLLTKKINGRAKEALG